VVVTRYRCGACGNLTRFDVVTELRTNAFHHYNLGGELSVEDEKVLYERVVEVSCRWCGHGRAVERIAGPNAGASVPPADAPTEQDSRGAIPSDR
jgi:hypothetical protein